MCFNIIKSCFSAISFYLVCLHLQKTNSSLVIICSCMNLIASFQFPKFFFCLIFGNSQYELLFSVNLHSLEVKYFAFKHEYYFFKFQSKFFVLLLVTN